MTMNERKDTANEFIKASRKHGIDSINVHVSCMSIKDTQELAKHAESIGATTVSVLPNMFHKPSTTHDVIEYIRDVAGSLHTTKVMYVNIPEVTNVYIRLTEVLAFGADIPQFGGIHDSGVDMTDLSRALWTVKANPQLSVICSRNVDITPALAIGCKSFIGPSVNFCLPIYRKIAIQYQEEEGLKLQFELLNALAVCCKYGLNVAMLKACTEKVGNIELGGVRKPLKNCPVEVIDALDTELNSLNFWQRVKISSNGTESM
ncbi:hypothetical protein ACOME3_002569 [Neoechinorhynchus agilis]